MSRKPYKYRLFHLFFMQEENSTKTQTKLAELCRVTPSTINRWTYIKIDEHYDIPFTSVIKIAGFFNIPPQEVYTDFERTLNDDFNRVNNERI